MRIDDNGDRETDYSLWDMSPTTGDFQVSETNNLMTNPTFPPMRLHERVVHTDRDHLQWDPAENGSDPRTGDPLAREWRPTT
ncbi:hypothetical protein GDO81_021427 [Engystomops pustulosus]|uniref:Uncharacterized protein n=1 Tax=Engystomops pustulosus TaxID=76066 RepID=A0AAV6ZRL9_ENGPU|nr:hypothetical protein GDO81_021427 [Engystomops pustulosus]